MYGAVSKDLMWVRLKRLDIGIAIKRTPMLFSERNKIKKYLPLGFGWRMIYLGGLNE